LQIENAFVAKLTSFSLEKETVKSAKRSYPPNQNHIQRASNPFRNSNLKIEILSLSVNFD
jgi:hypothetical protein